MQHSEIEQLLGDESAYLLGHSCSRITKEQVYHPHANQPLDVMGTSDRSLEVVESLRRLYATGRLGGSGYLSLFPVDQGIEHTAAYSFYRNPAFFDPITMMEFAVEAGASGIASTVGALGLGAKQFADKIPFIVKLNHNELLTYPNKYDQVVFGSVRQAKEMGAAGIGATIYFGSLQSNRQIQEVADLFQAAHQQGLFTVLWCYPRSDAFSRDDGDYSQAVDVTAQAIHLGVTLEADIIKQKQPTALRAFPALNFSKYDQEMYDALLTDHPIDMVRYQVAHSYMGRIPLITSGGESLGDQDLREAVKLAVINKRAGGSGLIMGRKVFKRSFDEGKKILQAVQDVYLDGAITVA
jgi:fructose-bisphosphate aldolase, class I